MSHMQVKNIKDIQTVSEFNELITKSNKSYILCDFHADWCGPCKNIGKVLPELYYPYVNNFDFIKINIDNEEFTELTTKCDIKKIPTFIVFKSVNGEIANKITTANPQQLKNFINSTIDVVANVDVDTDF